MERDLSQRLQMYSAHHARPEANAPLPTREQQLTASVLKPRIHTIAMELVANPIHRSNLADVSAELQPIVAPERLAAVSTAQYLLIHIGEKLDHEIARTAAHTKDDAVSKAWDGMKRGFEYVLSGITNPDNHHPQDPRVALLEGDPTGREFIRSYGELIQQGLDGIADPSVNPHYFYSGVELAVTTYPFAIQAAEQAIANG